MELAWDRSTCELKARRTVTTDTVRVFVQATVTQSGEHPAEPRGEQSSAASTSARSSATGGNAPGDVVGAALATVLAAAWGVSGASREEDSAGMERVRLVATARVPEQQAAGLVDRLRRASRPGLRLKLQRIEYRPPLARIDAALRELRQEIYREARREAELLNAELPSDTMPWRVGNVQITEQVGPPPDLMRGSLSPTSLARSISVGSQARSGRAEDETEEPAGVEAGVQVEVVGKVTLNRLALPLEVFLKAGRRPE